MVDTPDIGTLFTFEKLQSANNKQNLYLRKYITKDSFVLVKNVKTNNYINLKTREEAMNDN